MKNLFQMIKSALQEEQAMHEGWLKELKEIVTPKQHALFLAWMLGMKNSDDYAPVMAQRVAKLQHQNPFGRYLPSFEVLSAIQVDTVDHALRAHAEAFSAAMSELVAATKSLAAADAEADIASAIAMLHDKRTAVAVADRAGIEELVSHLGMAQRGEVAAVRGRLLLPVDMGTQNVETAPPWWTTAVTEAALTPEQITVIDEKMSQLREAQETLQPQLQAVEERLPNAAGLVDAVEELEKGQQALLQRSQELQTQMLGELKPLQQKVIVLATLQPVIA